MAPSGLMPGTNISDWPPSTTPRKAGTFGIENWADAVVPAVTKNWTESALTYCEQPVRPRPVRSMPDGINVKPSNCAPRLAPTGMLLVTRLVVAPRQGAGSASSSRALQPVPNGLATPGNVTSWMQMSSIWPQDTLLPLFTSESFSGLIVSQP